MPRVTRSRVRPPAPPSAPLAAYTPGSQVGTPTGTSLTATTGLPSPDSIVTWTGTDPITGAVVSIPNVKKFFRRSWAATLGSTVPSGEVWWFAEGSAYTVDIDTSSGANNRLSPTLIFSDFTIGPTGSSHADKALTSQRTWLDRCDVNQLVGANGNCEDGWIGAAYSTILRSNIRAGVGTNTTDPHADGIQLLDTGEFAAYLTWIDGGVMDPPLNGNAAIRQGTEFGAATNIRVWYCGIGGNSFNNVQFRGDNGPASSPITGVSFRGNRWCSDGAGFEYDFQQEGGGGTMISEWSDNLYGIDCTIGGTPFAAGQTVTSPGI